MSSIVAGIKWIMLVSGALTCTMFFTTLAPHQALVGMFGETVKGPVAEIVVRNWGALIALVGAMLIYGATRPESRPLVLTVAAVSKLVFIGLVLVHGRDVFSHQAGVAVVGDLLMVLLFAAYLVGTRGAAGKQP